VSDAILQSSVPNSISVEVLEFSPSKEWFFSALMGTAELQDIRKALEDAGFSPLLPSKAKIFVNANVFELVVQHLVQNGWDLKARHVVVASDLLHRVLAVVERARVETPRRVRGSFKIKSQTEVNVHIPEADDCNDVEERGILYIVKRTFVHVPFPSSMRSASSVHPATV